MSKHVLTFLSAIAIAGAAHAQISFGPELGLNIAKYPSGNTTLTPVIKSYVGMRIGAVADISLNKNWAIQPGAFYVMNGVKQTYNVPTFGTADLEMKINTIEIPVNVMYKFGEPGGNRFFVGAGPYLGINVGGEQSVSIFGLGATESLKIGSDSTDAVKRFDVGAGLNLGYELSSGVFFRARYQMGFVNLLPMGDADNYARAGSYGVSIGYLFHGKKKVKSPGTSAQ